ncbi:hypothetical protein BHE16_11600 [Neomicrococcus aestuarii]|uniref:Uncharacterized protein n=1 Tax=Neomicrococcus aestuarii TaxID=556325 RepID=A0A1L2ZQ02_9MICC|nr:hypothetical protein BHE16_11600 [Neomicrococcus aestuarii]
MRSRKGTESFGYLQIQHDDVGLGQSVATVAWLEGAGVKNWVQRRGHKKMAPKPEVRSHSKLTRD